MPGSEAQQAIDMLDERFPAVAGTTAQLVFAVEEGTLDDPSAAAAVDTALADVGAQPYVSGVSDVRLSPDGRIAYADVQYTEPVTEIRDEACDRLTAMAERATQDGVQLELGGELPGQAEDPRPAGQEAIGLLAAVIVLLLAFGSVIAMGLPVGTALLGLATSFGLISLVAAIVDVTDDRRKLTKAARKAGLDVGRDQVARLMRAEGIRGASRSKRRFTTHSDPAALRAPDLLRRDFTATRPNHKWVADFERQEAPTDRAVMKGHRLRAVAAARVKLRAA